MKRNSALKALRRISIIVFLSGSAMALVAYLMNRPKSPTPSRGFVLTSIQTFKQLSTDSSVQVASRVRYQKSDGTFRLSTTYVKPDGSVKKEVSTFGLPGRGVFEVDLVNSRLNFLSPMALNRLPVTEAILRNNPHFIREDSVMGYRTYVLRTEDGTSYTEVHYALDLQCVAIKRTMVSESTLEVIEPVKIEVVEPDENVLRAMPDLPVSYEFYDEQNKQAEAQPIPKEE